MSLAVTLTMPGSAPVDITGYLQNGELSLSRGLGREGAGCSFALVRYGGEVRQGTILVTWNGTPVYRGEVQRRKRVGRGNVVFVEPDCADGSIRMRRVLVAATYAEQNGTAIVDSLITRYMPGVTRAIGVMQVPLQETFNYVPLDEAVKRVADKVGAYWMLQPDNTFRFFSDYYDDGLTPAFTSSNMSGDSFTDEATAGTFANSITIVGAESTSPEWKRQTFTGASDAFALAYRPNYTEVRVNGFLKSTLLKGSENASTANFIVDKKARLVVAKMALIDTDVVEIKYRPSIELVELMENPASIMKYGRYERVIKERDISDRASARLRAKTELTRSSTSRPSYSWNTTSETAITLYPGRRISVAYPLLGVNAFCRLTDVDVRFSWNGYRWHIDAGLKAEGLTT